MVEKAITFQRLKMVNPTKSLSISSIETAYVDSMLTEALPPQTAADLSIATAALAKPRSKEATPIPSKHGEDHLTKSKGI